MSGSHANKPQLLLITGMLGIGGIHSEDLFADMGFDFGGFGFFNRSVPAPRGSRRGADIRVDLFLPPTATASGGEEVVAVAHERQCARCGGSSLGSSLDGEKLTVRIPQPAPSSAWSENCSTCEHLAQSSLGAHGLRHNAVAHSDAAAAISRVISAN